VHEARENIRTEMQDNQKSIRDALNDIHQEQKEVEADLVSFALLESKDRPKHSSASIRFHFSDTTLSHASWDTARETGALEYMPYAEVKSYAELQDLQHVYMRQSERLTDAYSPAIAYLYSFIIGQPAKHPESGPTGFLRGPDEVL
jgi:hypothetical protein